METSAGQAEKGQLGKCKAHSIKDKKWGFFKKIERAG